MYPIDYYTRLNSIVLTTKREGKDETEDETFCNDWERINKFLFENKISMLILIEKINEELELMSQKSIVSKETETN